VNVAVAERALARDGTHVVAVRVSVHATNLDA
jgi:hypothetical protein